MNIHDFVNDIKEKFANEIRAYIQSVFDDVIDTLAIQHNIEKELIRETLNTTLNKSVRKCALTTKLGHRCKYNAKEGHTLCLKHFNKQLVKSI